MKQLSSTTWTKAFMQSLWSKRGVDLPELTDGDYIFRVKTYPENQVVDVSLWQPDPPIVPDAQEIVAQAMFGLAYVDLPAGTQFKIQEMLATVAQLPSKVNVVEKL